MSSAWQRIATAPAGRRTAWSVLTAWLLIAVAATMFAKTGDVETNDLSSWLPASAESTRALELAEREFPAAEPEQLLLVYVRDGGLTTADRDAAAADATALAALAAGPVPPPIPSEDGAALLVTVPLSPAQTADEAVGPVLDQARTVLTEGLPAGLGAWMTGGPAAGADFDAAFDSLDTTLLGVTVGVVALLLLLTYRSPVLLLVPLFAVGVASQLASALVYVGAKYLGLVVNGASAGILTVLVFGAGTDYALLLISRYREELTRHADHRQAMRLALRHSLPAIIASAVTVILALLTLLAAGLNSTRGLGPVAALGIVSALLAMTTLLPALLVMCGRRVFWPLVPAVRGAAEPARGPGLWARTAGYVSRHARPIWIVTALGLAALSLGATTLDTGLRQSESFVTKPDSVRGFEVLATHFPAGSGDPTEVYLNTTTADRVTGTLRGLPGVAEVGEAEPSLAGGWTRLRIVLADAPSSDRAEQTVLRLRDAAHAVDPSALVGGATAQELDENTTMDADLRLLIPLILAVVLGVLIVLLRSLVAPLLLLGSVLLSFGAALGAAALIYHAIGFPAIDRSVLLHGFLFLVALGVDYTIFLMTRAREEVAVHGHAEGVTRALSVTGSVITSAGVVLAATFSVLSLMPVVFMMQVGILVGIGVLLDTFIVRTLLVPALVHHVGPRTWWPRHP
ncbi:MMPL family transporter [Catellatospora chokoriensis]|uniref:Membrane protein n=1 Tax=Catellatospora chokoriensis TaxID=310353 RepID=A0A8J3JN12_9ACTN|nr:MMPL family transporter [Catellatospora chokoriensis]GIF87872.1 membrane protein [Catellatospora chokoriensis]